jgi:predicted ATP-grasp superfamily ATP-dependent carboligase
VTATGSPSSSRSRGGAVLVTDAGRPSALAVIRSLGRAGWRVVAASSDRVSPGLHSRHAAVRVRYPKAHLDPAGAVEAILATTRRHHVELVVPVTDDVIAPLAAARHRFEGVAALAVAGDAALAGAWDKLATVRLAEAHGIAVPRTVAVDELGPDAAVAAAAGLGWPVVVKPRRSYTYLPGARPERRWVGYAFDEAELRRRLAAAGEDVLLQAHHRGAGVGVGVLAHEGRLLAAFQHRRLREFPLTGGASTCRVSEAPDPTLLDAAATLLGALEWTGLAMVEFRVGDAGAVLMEINGRVWGALPLAVASGMDFPARLAALHVDGAPPGGGPPDTGYRVGVRSRDLDGERAWMAAVLRGGAARPPFEMPPRREALAVALGLLRRGCPVDGFDRHDPIPGALEVVRVAAGVAGRLRDQGPGRWRQAPGTPRPAPVQATGGVEG